MCEPADGPRTATLLRKPTPYPSLRHNDRHLRHRLRHWRLHQLASVCTNLHLFALSHDGSDANDANFPTLGLRGTVHNVTPLRVLNRRPMMRHQLPGPLP